MHTEIDRRSLLKLAAGVLVLPSALVRGLPTEARTGTPLAVASLTEVLAQGVAAGIPGTVMYGRRGDGTPALLAAGQADLETGRPVETSDRFRIYSITKTFTAAVALQLVDEGILNLDATVPMLLDNAAAAGIPNIDRITLRQLLNHTSGIYDYFDDNGTFLMDAFLGPDADWSKVWTPAELLAYADSANAQPYFAPGEGAHYSNTNYILVGLIIEQTTGHRFGEELRARILDPLNLTETSFAAELTEVTGTVKGYQLLDGELVDVSATNLSWAYTAGGIVSTAEDVAHFAAALFDGTVVSAESFAEMTHFGAGGEGMGLYQMRTPDRNGIGMDGESAGFSSVMARFEEDDLTLVILTNLAPGGATFERLRDAAIEVMLASGD